jgi:hypothetical protein
MTLGPALFGEIFNLIYGAIYDHHSITRPGGALECTQGKYCYQAAYWVTFAASVTVMAMTLAVMKHRSVKEDRLEKQDGEADEDHIA